MGVFYEDRLSDFAAGCNVRNFVFGLLAGMGVMVVAGVAFVMAFGLYFSGPRLKASLAAPSEIVQGEPFELRVDIENPHDESIELDNLDIPDAFFDTFEFVSIEPQADEDSPFVGFGRQTWFYDLAIEPEEQLSITLVLRARVAGNLNEGFEVCNHYEDCTPLFYSAYAQAAP